MNLRKGFFRLTLVLSILVGSVSSFWLLEHTIEYDASHAAYVYVGDRLEYKTSHEAGIIKRCLPYGLYVGLTNEEKARTAERLAKESHLRAPEMLELLRLLDCETHEPFGPDYILYWWRHLALLTLPGFFTVWFIYGLTRWVIIPFIVRGFKDNSAKGSEPG
jgi:hypothetical protein